MRTRLHLTRGSGLAAALLGAVLLLLGAPAAPAHATSGPQLSIAVDDGATSAKAGDELAYTITVTNLGTTRVRHLRVSQTVPTGASVVSTGAHGKQTKGKISWSVDLDAAQKVTMRTTLALGSTPSSALRLATVACAQVSTTGPALVCASDSDQLPPGAAITTAQADAPADAPAAARLDGRTGWITGGGAAVLLAAAGTVLLVRHRRTHAPDVALGARVAGRE